MDAKFKVSDICKILDCDKNRVYDVIKLKKLGLSLKPKYAGGKRTVRTEEFTEGIWSVCYSDPSMKMRKMAKHVEASRSTVRRAVREDLCLFPYKHRKTQLIPFKKRPVRVKRGMKILAYLEEHPDTIVLWSDEKQWNVDTTVNQQNDRYLAYCIQDVPEVHRTTRPAGAMMLGVIASDANVLAPLWIDKGTKVDSRVYIENLKKVKAWVQETYGDRLE